MERSDISQRLINLRQSLGLSQRDMANEFNVSASALAMWEKKSRPIPGIVARMIEIYEEALNDEIALRKHSTIIRHLCTTWSDRLLCVVARGARVQERQEIKSQLEHSLFHVLTKELSPIKVRRNIQISILNRIMTTVSRSRGLPMKFAQALSYLNPTMSLETRNIIDRVHTLQQPMAPTIVSKIIVECLGESPYKLFKSWSATPYAMASIGQVHKAQLHTGEVVAVKVQYPEIRQSLENDLKAVGLLINLISLPNIDKQALLSHIQSAVLEETDYLKEADNLEVFAKLFQDEEKIIIPKVYRNYSCANVLTMEFIDGKSLQDFTQESFEERKRSAETLCRYITKSIFEFQRVNTDTHRNNFVFCGNGKVGVLDFGRVVSKEAVKKSKGQRDIFVSLVRKDKVAFAKCVLNLSLVKDPNLFDIDGFWEFFLKQQAHLCSGEFLFTNEHIIKTLKDLKNSEIVKDLKFDASSIWEISLAVGMWNVFSELNVPINYGQIGLDALGVQ